MIKDKDIDLTVGNVFATPPEGDEGHIHKTMLKLGKKRSPYDVLEKYCINVYKDMLPWVQKESEYNVNRHLKRRSYDDVLSDEAQCTIRLTSGNTLMTLGDRWFIDDDVREEFFYEFLGYDIPYTSIKRCYGCGSITFGRAKDLAFSCPKCELREFPWERHEAWARN